MDDNELKIEALKLLMEEERRKRGGVVGEIISAPFKAVTNFFDDLLG